MTLKPMPIRFGSVYVDVKRYPNQYLLTQKVAKSSPLPQFTVSVVKDNRNTFCILMPYNPNTEATSHFVDVGRIDNAMGLREQLNELSARAYQPGDMARLKDILSPIINALAQQPDTSGGRHPTSMHTLMPFFKPPHDFGKKLMALIETHLETQTPPRSVPPGNEDCPYLHTCDGARHGRIPGHLFKDQCVVSQRHGRDIYDGLPRLNTQTNSPA